MNASIYRISLELQDTQANVNLDVKRGDTKRILHISLTDGGKPYQISDECTAVFTALKPDGKKVFNDCQISGNEILYTLTPQTVVAEGVCQCGIKLYGADSGLLTSARFELAVNETVYNEGDVIESTDEFNELTRLIGEASAVPSSVLLKEDDKLDDLVRNGRYYLAGGTDNPLIRQMLRDAGVPVPEEMNAEGIFARAMFVDVTRVEGISAGPDDPVGQPCQHLTVHFKKDRSEDAWAFEYHRVHSFTGSHPDGSAWGGWITATKNHLEVEPEIVTFRYGEATLEQIRQAKLAKKIVFATDGASFLLLQKVAEVRAVFSSFSDGVNRRFVVTGFGWEDVSDKYLKEDEIQQTFVAEYGVTTADEVCQAFLEGKGCFAKRNIVVLPMVNCDVTRRVVYFCGMDYGFYMEYRLSAGGWQEIREDYRKAEEIAEDTSDDLIPTVGAVWDLAEKKLDADKLPEAVEAALAQAKASGEFDGAPGPQGEKGEPGEQGPPGEAGTENLMVVNVKAPGYTADKTHAEITAAYLARNGIIAFYNGRVFAVSGRDPGGIYFNECISDTKRCGKLVCKSTDVWEYTAVDLPEALPNPHPLTFTGAVEATYDGSKAVEVVIPQGGGGGSSVGGWKKVAEYVWDGNKEYQPLALDYATGEMVFDTAPPTRWAMWPVPNIDGVSNPVDLHSLYAKIPNEFLNAGPTSGMALSENGYTFGGVTKIAEGGVNANVDVSAFRFEVNNTVPSFSGLNAKRVKISFFAPGGNVWQNNGGFNFNAKLSNGQTVNLAAASGTSRLLYGWYEQDISVENNVLRNYFSLYGRFFKTRTSATQSGTNEKEGSVYPVFAVPDGVTIAEVYFSTGNGSYRPCNGTVVEVYVYED